MFSVLSGLGCAAVALRPGRITLERSAWLAFALAMTANTLTEVLEVTGSQGMAGTASSLAGGVTFVLACIALVVRVRVRLGSLSPIACLDGMTGAIAAMTALALLILGPAAHGYAHAGHSEFASVLLYPFADVLFLGMVAAATAENGWHSSGWLTIALALLLMTIGDCISAAHGSDNASWSRASACVFWIAAVWALATSAWIPVHGESDRRTDQSPVVPICLSAVMLALLLICTQASGTWKGTVVLAAIGTVIVTVRFGLTIWLNAKLLKIAEAAATTDVLTGLRNRRQLDADLDALLRVCRPDRVGGLVLFDLNGFKAYNDAFGHPAGDGLLAMLADRLSEAMQGLGVAYRLGGDEFCVLIPQGSADLHEVAARAASALTVTLRGQAITTAAGLALIPQDAVTPAEALRIADLRMYEHKYRRRTDRAERVRAAIEHEFVLEHAER